MESYPHSAHSALGFRASRTDTSLVGSPHSARSVIGLVTSRCSAGSRSAAMMRTGEVFLTRSRLNERLPDRDVNTDSDESPPATRKRLSVSEKYSAARVGG